MENSKYNSYSVYSVYKRIFKYALKTWPILLVSLVLMIATMLLSNVFPLITSDILDNVLINSGTIAEKLEMLDKRIIIYGILFLALVILRYLYQVIFTLCSMKLEKNIRFDAMDKLNRLKIEYFDNEPDGKIVTRLNNDVGGLRSLYQVFLAIIQSVINIIVVYFLIFKLQRTLAIYILILIPIIILWITYFRKIIYKLNNSLRELSSKINAKINELVSGVSVIQIFNQEKEMLEDYNELVLDSNKKQFKLSMTNAVFGWELLLFIKRFVVAGIIFFFGFALLEPETVITVGLIYAFITYIDRIVEPINQIFNNINALEDSRVAANRIFTFLDEEEDYVSENTIIPKTLQGDIKIENLNFSYIENISVLNNLNLEVKFGEQVGIVGHTGSGKSSLMNLLCLFYYYDDGKIIINGHDIKEYEKHEYRNKVGIVLQTPQLFKGTIKENITMNDDSVRDDVIYKILDRIGAIDIVNKYDRKIYEEMTYKGDNLSVGEKQLIAFARILLKNPDILILDEATANIDTETELKIKNAMQIISKNRTTFIIAHRLSTVKNCDKIIVLEKGNIVGIGTHDSLMKDCEVYNKIHESQYKNVDLEE